MGAKRVKHKQNLHKSRKQLRKEERKNKKIRRNEYYSNRRKPGQFVLLKKNNNDKSVDNEIQLKESKKQQPKNDGKAKNLVAKIKPIAEEAREKEKKQQLKLQKEMNKQRKKQLVQANLEEDRNIKRLEKDLKLNKRKSTAVPASFARDGLDYLLEVCDPENLKSSALAEQQLAEVNDEFEEDLVLMTGSKKRDNGGVEDEEFSEDEGEFFSDSAEEHDDEAKEDSHDEEEENEEFFSDSAEEEEEEEEETESERTKKTEGNQRSEGQKRPMSDSENDTVSEEADNTTQRKTVNSVEGPKTKKKRKSSVGSDFSDNFDSSDDFNDANSDVQNSADSAEQEKDDGTWEDIYGRLRTKDGTIIDAKSGKYVPPGARNFKEESDADKARSQKLEKLKRQLKGLINRLAESNMHSIATQIEELYMNNSRHDMNSTITSLVLNALVTNVVAPERLLMEHILLIIILHANVGTEVGAHFLQTVVNQFDENFKSTQNTESKKLDNIVIILSQLYNFKLFDSKLIYEFIDKLVGNFGEKNVECILHILRNVGFNLRKDNPLALKNLILTLQKKAFGASDDLKDNSRVKFMLDILLAIKNNNVTKIPNYDTTYSEHLKKIMKGFIRKGNYVTQLNISLEDLLRAEEKGKWWVIGSAWTGNRENDDTPKNNSEKPNSFSQKLLDLAVKQRMNTDTRKNVFCIIMSAEDYLDAFEKLLRLGLKNQQEREIINVILHCSLQEKAYNPYYATLAQKFCEYDRKYQMTIKYSIWDKLKALKDHSATQISHLAKLLSHLFIEKGLPISTLKIVQFSELDKVTLRFIRQILLGILLHDDLDVCKGVFEKVGYSEKLKMFRESLRLFLYHFLLRNLDSQGIAEAKKELLQQRVKVVEKLLTGRDTKLRY